MSINAYRMIEGKMGNVSFNLYHDSSLVDFLDIETQIYAGIHDGTGLIDVPIEILEKAVRQSEKLNIDKKTLRCLKQDIQYARSNKEEVVTYYCF